ncbi:MAG: hypothetical protein H7A53_09250 [Akkermansiaceae bacterium]|nr:hypothetical protein [Akkermansiaceae bacterium]
MIERMTEAGIEPDVIGFSTLLSKAADYRSASGVIERMTEAGIEPDVVNFSTLLSKAADYESASGVIERMTEAGIEPDVVSFTTLFKRLDGLPSIDEILQWYYAQPFHPSEPLNALISSLRSSKREWEAMKIALNHPHLSAGQRLIRNFPEIAKELFEGAKVNDVNHPTADLALGALAMQSNQPKEALRHLREALKRAEYPKQIRTIEKWLKQVEGSSGSQA